LINSSATRSATGSLTLQVPNETNDARREDRGVIEETREHGD
jgi:hypothetical protein